MSEENVEVAKRIYAGPLDMAAVFRTPTVLDATLAQLEPFFQPDFVTIHDPAAKGLGIGGPGGEGTLEGIEGFLALWRDFLSAWDSWVVTPTGFVDVDDERVLVFGTWTGQSKTHGAEMTLDGGNLLTFRDGKVARLELFFKRSDALEAAGLSE